MRGYAYDRRDVTGRGLANAYAQTLGTIFSSGGEKPYEVELFVAEIGDAPEDDQIYRLTYDGQVADVHNYAVMGGAADVVATYLEERYAPGESLDDAIRLAVSALGHTEEGDRVIPAEDLEVAVLDRTRSLPRKFLRILPARLTQLLGDRGPSEPNPEPEVESSVPAHAASGAEGPPSPPPTSTGSGDDDAPVAPPG
jgi:proteasome alpha subunit